MPMTGLTVTILAGLRRGHRCAHQAGRLMRPHCSCSKIPAGVGWSMRYLHLAPNFYDGPSKPFHLSCRMHRRTYQLVAGERWDSPQRDSSSSLLTAPLIACIAPLSARPGHHI